MTEERLCSVRRNGRPIVVGRQFQPEDMTDEMIAREYILPESSKTKCRYTADGTCEDCTFERDGISMCKDDGKKDQQLRRPYDTDLSRANRKRKEAIYADHLKGMTYKELGVKYGLVHETIGHYVRQLRD